MKSSKLSVIVLAIAVWFPAMVNAATITVDDLNDNNTAGDGNCTLREAINNANSDSDTTSSDCPKGKGLDTIVFTLSGTITLGSQLPEINHSDALTIDGAGQDVVISGNNAVRILTVGLGATLHVRKLTLSNGVADDGGIDGNGGAIYSIGTLNVADSIFSGNTAILGGAVRADGILTVANSTFSHNTALFGDGGAIDVGTEGTTTVTNSTFVGNSVTAGNNLGGNGGAIASNGTLNVISSTFSGNAAQHGGAISNETGGDPTLIVANSTFSGNRAAAIGGHGGAIHNESMLTVTNTTFSGNDAQTGGGIYNHTNGTLNILNTIIGNSGSGDDCVNTGILGTNMNNLIEDGSCSPALTGDPKLQNLNNNGGPTETMALDSDSPAIDAGDNATCAAAPVNNRDQRRFVRPIDGNSDSIASCDIGAYEFGSSLPPIIEAPIDIRFCENPNTFNCKQKGSLPVTIFGSADLDVSEIDISTIQLCLASDPNECVSMIDAEFPQDRGNPNTDLGINRCSSANPDGFDDLDVLFVAPEVAPLIECSTIGKGNASPTLIIKFELNDGSQFQSTPVDDIGIDQLQIVTK